jgi:hypothetical protein
MLMHYDWTRFLVPRHGGIGLDSFGFLRNPCENFGKLDNPDLVVFSDLAHLPVVVLLGEPGMGKTTLLDDAAVVTKTEGRNPIRIDLSQYGEDRLVGRLKHREIL